MKTKNLKKKLALSKVTVANLENFQMNALKGGVLSAEVNVPSCTCASLVAAIGAKCVSPD